MKPTGGQRLVTTWSCQEISNSTVLLDAHFLKPVSKLYHIENLEDLSISSFENDTWKHLVSFVWSQKSYYVSILTKANLEAYTLCQQQGIGACYYGDCPEKTATKVKLVGSGQTRKNLMILYLSKFWSTYQMTKI